MTQRKDRIQVQIAGKEFSVVGGSFQEMLAAVKQINGRRFVSELKAWQLPGTVDEIQRQLDIGGYRLEGGIPVSDTPQPRSPASPRPGGDRIRIVVSSHRLAVVGGNFQEMLAVVKGLPGRRFDGEAKVWEIPGDVGVIKGMVEAAGFELEGAEQLPVTPVPSMETSGSFTQQPPPPPPYEPPDFLEAADEFPFEPPDWLEDGSPPEEADYFFDGPPSFEAEPQPSTPPASRAAPGSDQIRLRLGDTPLIVTGGSFQAMLAVVKTIPGRRFDSGEKAWYIPADVTLDSVQQAIKAAGFVLMPDE
jgi:hypothetical protein